MRWGAAWIVLAAGAAAIAGCATTPEPMAASEPVPEPWPAAEPGPVELRTCAAPEHLPFPPELGGAPVDVLPEAIAKVPPAYPPEARQRGVDGVVRFHCLVCEHGRVVKAIAVDSIPLLDDAARDALAQWTFRPAQSGGRAVAAWTDVPLRFALH